MAENKQRFVLLGCSTVIGVPTKLAKCPYCEGKLTVSFDGWDQQEDGTWAASGLQVNCETEPSILDGEIWEAWLSFHSEMPYVYMLPVEEKIKSWLYRWARFEMEEGGQQ